MAYVLISRSQALVNESAREAAPRRPGERRGCGTPLPARLQQKMEHAFGFNFDAVRVHQGREAAELNTVAYTQATDLHFAPGRYDPNSARGQAIIGHELAHVVQQHEGRVTTTDRLDGVGLNDDPGLECEAKDWGTRAAQGEAVRRVGAAGVAAPGAAGIVAPGASPVQRYTEYTKDGVRDSKKRMHWQSNTNMMLRVSDDGTAAVVQDEKPKELYVLQSRLGPINAAMRATKMPVQLDEVTGVVSGAPPLNLAGTIRSLVRVTPNRDIPCDCREAAYMVTGADAEGKELRASFADKRGERAISKYNDPEMMKYEIMLDRFRGDIGNADNALPEAERVLAWTKERETAAQPYLDNPEYQHLIDVVKEKQQKVRVAMEALTLGLDKEQPLLRIRYTDAQTEVEEASKAVAEWSKTHGASGVMNAYYLIGDTRDLVRKKFMTPYESKSWRTQRRIDKQIGINRYADPDIGGAYSISEGSPKQRGDIWNFHWAAVLFKSTTGSDNVTMENFANEDEPADNWSIQMYGVPTAGRRRYKQTFHEQHKDMHGFAPTTLATEKVEPR